MALDFIDFEGGHKGQWLFAIDDAGFESMSDVLSVFYKKTGLTIDQYGRTRIHPDHVKLIISYIKKQLDEMQISGHKHDKIKKDNLSLILNNLLKVPGELLAEGD